MNKTFHSVWNASKQAYVAAAETVSAKGKPSSGVKVATTLSALFGGLLSLSAHAQTAPPPNTLPTLGQVSAGQANISQSGANMVIQQSTDRAAINWQTFNVGKDAQVQFQQPSANSVTLNRVMSSDPSQIFGRISANGQVILTNPAGVYFGKDARVDVGGLIATTHGISDADFMAGNNRYERNGATGSVVNEGELKAALGGYIALLAPEVRNQGAVIAHMGTVALAAGEAIDLKFDANNRLTSIRVEPSQIQALVDNQHAVQAPGGLVIISAQSMDRLVGGVVKNSGAIEATGLQSDGGRIVLSASKTIENNGTLNASSATGAGGSVSLQADNITLQNGTRIDATGAQGGGKVLVGGNWQGSADPLLQATGQPSQQATTVTMAAGASIDASATQKGDGGTVVLWSDVSKPDSVTTAQGSVLAQGGAQGGNGGQVETSGHSVDIDGFRVDTLAIKGNAGLWLIDPYDYTINTSQASTISTALNGSNVTVTTTAYNASYGSGSSGVNPGNIFVYGNITKSSGTATTLTLQADSKVYLYATLSGNMNVGIDTTGLNGPGGISLATGRSLTVNQSGDSIYQGVISGTGVTLTKGGAGRLSLLGVNTYTGGTTLSGGILGLYNNAAAGTGPISLGASTTLRLGRAVTEIANDITLTGAATVDLDTQIDYLLVGGGGGGGSRFGSGGGGGGLVEGSTNVLTTSVAVEVGAGGAGGVGSAGAAGKAGGDSSLVTDSKESAGGGAGGKGASGAGGTSGAPQSLGGANGGFGGGDYYYGGGGGGAGGTGTGNTATGVNRAKGGNGLGSSLTGNTYGGGGGGGAIAGSAGAAGAGGGGAGGKDNTVGSDGTNGLGGGGGGGGVSGVGGTGKDGGDGGSGTVVIRYLGGSAGTGGSITAAGAYTLHTFTTAGSGTLTFNVAPVFSGVISGTGSLTVSAAGGLITLSGNSSYTGSTTVVGGVVQTNHANALGSNSAVTVSSGATLSLNTDLSIGSLTGSGNLNLGGTLQTGSDNSSTAFSGVIAGGGGLTKVGTGTFSLANSNSYTGITTINGGVLSVDTDYNLGTEPGSPTAGKLVINNGTLNARGVVVSLSSNRGITLTNTGSLDVNSGATLTYAGIMAGTGSLTKSGAGTLSLSGLNSYTGTTTVSAGSLQLGAAGNSTNTPLGTATSGTVVASGATLDLNGFTLGTAEALTLNGTGIASGGALTNSSATAATYSGLLTLGSASSVVASNGGLVLSHMGTITGATFGLTLGGTNTASSMASILGTTSGTLTKLGTGTWSLLGNNTYTGITTISAGTLRIGAGGTTGSLAGDVLNNAALIFNRSNDLVYSGVVSGTGALTTEGTGTLTLLGNNTYTGTTTISAGTLQLGNGQTTGAFGTGAVTNNAALVFNRSNTLQVSSLISGTGSLTQQGSGTLTLTQNNTYSSANTIAAGVLVLSNNAPNPSNKVFVGTGQLRIEPTTTTFTSPFATTAWSFANTLSGLTLGKDGNTANITLANATSIAGPISIYGGNIAINAALASTGATASTALITLKGTGNVTDGPSGYVVAGDQTVPGQRGGSLLLLGGNVTLDNIANNDVYTVAASGVSGLTYLDYSNLLINTVGTTSGVSATGVVNIGTQIGSLIIQKDVTTTNASANALTLNASIGSAVGTDFLYNLRINVALPYIPTISVGSGGVGRLYTGGISNVQRLSMLTSLTPGHFRYNADETTNFATGSWTNLSSGVYAIYREQPSASVTVASKSMTYGDAMPTLTGSVTGALNGDSANYAVSNRLNSTSGNIKVGSYTLTENGLAGLGYNVTSLTTGTLSVAQKDLTLTGLLAADKTYDRNTAATISSYGALSGTLSGDVVSLDTTGTLTKTFADWNAGNNKTVTVTGLNITGADSANYTLGTQTTTASIAPKALTLTAATDSKVYDGTTASYGTVNYSTLVAGDSISGLSQSFASKNVQGSNGSELKVDSGYTISGDGNGGYNYAVTLVSAQGTITPKALTISGLGSANKVYDGNTTAVVTGPAVLQTAITAGTGTSSDGKAYSSDTVSLAGTAIGTFNSKDLASANTVSFSGLSLSGLDAGNYSLTQHATASQTITPAMLTITANNDAKFVTQTDPAFTVSYSGFVGGETATNAGLTGTLSVTRSSSGPDGNTSGSNTLAGTYTGAITATGLSASNYSIQTVPGDFTIVGSGQLLVRAQNAATTYGTGASYSITSASYWDTTLNSNTGGEVALTGITPNGNNNFTVADGQTATANFTLAPLNAVNSTAGKLKVGSYQLATSGTVTENSGNFSSNIVVVGAHEVTQKSLTPVVNTAAKTKVYDGSAAMSGLSLDKTAAGVLTSDLVTLGSDGGFFADKNVSRDGANALAANKSYTVSGLSLSGTDAGNYYLASNTLSGTDGQITPKTLTVGFTGVDKVYNGLTTATVNTSDNRVAGDSLSIARTAAFADKNVAYSGSTVIAKAISVAGVGLSGTDSLNYDLSGVTTGTTSAKITPASLVISGIVGVDKIYNNATTAALNVSGVQETGLMSGDTVTVTATGAFADVNAALGKAVTISSTYGGADKGNYTITDQTGTTASIFKREVMVIASNGVSKTYDGTTDMTGVVIGLGTVNGVTESGVVSGDTVNVSGTGSFSSATVSRDGSGNVLSDKSYTLADLQLSGANAANYMIVGGATSISGNNGRIDPKTLTLSGFSAQNKTYDGTNAAVIASAGTLTGVVGADAVTFGGTGTTFSDQNAATGKMVTLYGVTLGSTDAGNYSIASTATTTADITAKTLTVAGLVADNKTYNGTTAVTLSNWGAVATGIIGEALTLNHGSAVFDTANAGTGKTVTASGYSLADGTGGLASNYQLASASATTTADVAKASLTLSTSSVTKTYDGDTSATGIAVVTSGTLYVNASNGNVQDSIADGTFAFTDKNAGSGNKTVTVTGVTVNDGNSGGNYNVSYANNTASTINKATLTVTGTTVGDKVYDGTAVATLSNGTLVGVVGTESVTLTQAGDFSDKNAGTGKSVTATDTIGGTDVSNYTLTQPTGLSANITPKALTLSGLSSLTKVYDGTTTAAVNGTAALQTAITVGTGNGTDGAAYSGDTVSLTGAAIGNFNSKDVASATNVAFTGLSLTGAQAGNYSLTQHADDTVARITPKTVSLNLTSVSKVYDGQTAYNASSAELLTLSGQLGVAGDSVSTATVQYADKNVGTGKNAALSAVNISDGNGGSNYTVTLGSNSASTITRLSSVTWVGGTSGNWFDPANWAGGAVPDLANVANVVIPSGVSVSFGSAVVAPAESGTVSIDSLGSAGSALSQSAGTLAVGSGGMTLGGYTQSGGTLSNAGSTTLDSFTQSGGSFSGTGAMTIGSLAQTGGTLVASNNLTVTDSFSQGTSGSISVGGNTSITDTSGGTVLGNLVSTGALSVTSTDGAISQAAGTAITAQNTSSFMASKGINPALPADITLANSDNDFVGTVTATGDATSLADSNGMTVVLNTTGDTTLSSGGNLNVSGTVSGAGSDLSTTTTTSGSSTNFGATTIGGNLSTTTNNGDVTQSGALTVGGTTGLNAGTGSITLNNTANDFNGTVNANGHDIALNDANNLTLGNVATGGNLTVDVGGNIGQDNTSPNKIVVDGKTTLTAGASIVLNGTDNKFPKGVTVNARSYTITGDTRKAASEAQAKAQSMASSAQPGAASASSAPPQPLVMTSGTASASSSTSGSGNTAATSTGNSAGVKIELDDVPAGNATIMAAVSLPKGISVAGAGFSFELPEAIRAQAENKVTSQPTLPSGAPLPAWLKFDAQAMRFEAEAVPDGAFPMQVTLSVGGQRVLVVISERAE